MHQPDIQARASLYFPYQVYPYFASKEATRAAADTVTIVGAGPIGMTLALSLAKMGIKSVILTAEQQLSAGSRAIVYTKRSMEIMQHIGIAAPLLEKAYPWTAGNSIYKGKVCFRMDAPVGEHDQFYPLNNLQQNYLEQLFVDAIAKNPLIELRWGNKVIAALQSDDDVVLTIDTPEGEYQHTSAWVVAADGGRSPIREDMGLRMEGDNYEGRFVIADIRIKLPYPTERLAYFSPDWNPGNTILMHRQPDDIWRFDYQLSTDVTPEEALKPENLCKAVQDQLDMIGFGDLEWEMDWSTVYSARALTLADYVHGRIIFAGDAAHLLPIFGVRGANTGFQDAMDLAWKLAGVVQGWAKPEAVHTYTSDRVGAAREIIGEAGKSTRFMAPPSAGFRLLRNAVLSLSLEHEFVRPLYHWRTSRPHAYTKSAWNSVNDDNANMPQDSENGALLPNFKFENGAYLNDYLAGQFSVVVFAAAIPAGIQAEVAALKAAGVPVHIIAVSESASVAGADVSLQAASAALQQRFQLQNQEVYLVRPDQHVCGRWLQYRDQGISATLNPLLTASVTAA